MTRDTDHIFRRRGYLTSIASSLACMSGCLSGRTTDSDTSKGNVQLSNLHILKGPYPDYVRIAFSLTETDGEAVDAYPTIRFYDVASESVLPQTDIVELGANETYHYESGFLLGSSSPLTLEPGDRLLIAVDDNLIRTVEVREDDE